MERSELKRAVAEALQDGPMGRRKLASALRQAGHRGREAQVEGLIRLDASFVELEDEIAYVPAVVDGVAFAIPVSDADADAGFVPMHPWLDAIGWWLIVEDPELFDVDGKPIGPVETEGRLIDGVDTDIVGGPPGWLDAHRGRWLALRVDRGSLVLEAQAGPPEPPEEVTGRRQAAIRSSFERRAERNPAMTISAVDGSGKEVEISEDHPGDVLLSAIAEEREVFRGTPVVLADAYLQGSGLRLLDGMLVDDTVDAEAMEAAKANLAAMGRYGVDADAAMGIQVVLGAMLSHATGDPEAFGADDGERERSPLLFDHILQRPECAAAVAVEVGSGRQREIALPFAREALDRLGPTDGSVPEAAGPTSGASTPGLRWLEGHCLLSMGRIDEAVEILDEVPADEANATLLIDRAVVELHRSNPVGATRFLEKAGRLLDGSDTSLVGLMTAGRLNDLDDMLAVFDTVTPPKTARRNDPCPCGSGRKYKACHSGRDLHPLGERSALVWQRLLAEVRRLDRHQLHELAFEFEDAMGSSADDLADSPLISDLMLREGGRMVRYLGSARETMPADEATLLQAWIDTPRSVFEVVRTAPGTLELKDLINERTVQVVGLAGPGATAGETIVGRPLPVGDIHRSFAGFVRASTDRIDEMTDVLSEGSPEEIAHMLGLMHRPPR